MSEIKNVSGSSKSDNQANHGTGGYRKSGPGSFPARQRAFRILFSLFSIVAPLMSAPSQADLTGRWRCLQNGVETVLQIRDRTTLAIDGEVYQYRQAPGKIQVLEEGIYADYPFSLSGDTLRMQYPDGTMISFVKASGKSVKTGSPPDSPGNAPAERPETKSSAPALTGKWIFQGAQGAQSLEFLPAGRLAFNGETTQYTVAGSVIRAQTDYGWTDYPYAFSNGKLVITFPDGTRIPFERPSAQSSAGRTGGSGQAWQLQGSLCFYSGSSGSYSSYSRTEKITFDGRGNFVFGREGSFSGDAGLAYSGDNNADRGTYRIEGDVVRLQFSSGESYTVRINMRQDNGRITELMYGDKLYATALCE